MVPRKKKSFGLRLWTRESKKSWNFPPFFLSFFRISNGEWFQIWFRFFWFELGWLKRSFWNPKKLYLKPFLEWIEFNKTSTDVCLLWTSFVKATFLNSHYQCDLSIDQKVAQIPPNVAQKTATADFTLTCYFQNGPKSHQKFKIKFVTNNFHKLPNLVTLATT